MKEGSSISRGPRGKAGEGGDGRARAGGLREPELDRHLGRRLERTGSPEPRAAGSWTDDRWHDATHRP